MTHGGRGTLSQNLVFVSSNAEAHLLSDRVTPGQPQQPGCIYNKMWRKRISD